MLPTAEWIFVQLLLSGTEIIGTRHVNSGFHDSYYFADFIFSDFSRQN